MLIELLPKLRPYLRIKEAQADAALQFLMGRKQRGGPYTELDVSAAFNLRLTNQKSYNKGSVEHILYRKQPYTRDQFMGLIQEGRDGSIYRVTEWTSEMDALIGTDIDRRIAKSLNLKLAQVQRRRVDLGRPPFGWIDDTTKAEIRRLRKDGVTLKRIAAMLNVSFSFVQRECLKSRATFEFPSE